MLGVPLIINHDHTNDPHRIENKLLLALDKSTNRFAHHIITVASACRDFLVKHESIHRGKITLIPNAIDLRRFSPASSSLSESRTKLGLPQDVPVIAGVGRLNAQKNFALFLEIAAAVVTEIPEARFLLAGEGPEEPRLRAQAASLGIADRVLFAGYIPDTRIVYSAADILLMPSRFEGLPMTLLESMAMGLPIVASNLDGIAEVITDTYEGLLAEPGNAATFTSQVIRLLRDPDFAAQLAINARTKIESNHSVEIMTTAVESIYDKFLP